MKKISRGDFLKTSGLALVATFAPKNIFSESNAQASNIDEAMMSRLVNNNDNFVKNFLVKQNEPEGRLYYRRLSGIFASLTAAYCHPKSFYFKSKKVVVSLDRIIENLFKYQYPNGTLDSGGNRQLIFHV